MRNFLNSLRLAIFGKSPLIGEIMPERIYLAVTPRQERIICGRWNSDRYFR